jgi:hypothetical protein
MIVADFPQIPTASPVAIPWYPTISNGYAKLATPEDIEKDESGVTYPNLHRRIDVSLGLNTFFITVFGKPILKDAFENDLHIPNISDSEETIKSLITNAYDVEIVNVGDLVKDYITNYIVEGYEVNFIWVVRCKDEILHYADGYNLTDIINEVYRGTTPVLQEDTGEYHISAKVEEDEYLEKATYDIFTSATSSFRTTQYYTYNADLNSEIP